MTKKLDKTKIYENKEYFGGYLEATDEKALFIKEFFAKSMGTKRSRILDLGSFSCDLLLKLATGLVKFNENIECFAAVEPAAAPLSEGISKIKSDYRIFDKFRFYNMPMEKYLSEYSYTYDWTIASHSLYWMKNPNLLISQILKTSPMGVFVMRDEGMLLQIESTFRPRMINEIKTQFSSKDLINELTLLNIQYSVTSIAAKMRVPNPNTLEFKQLAGFLLDLQINEIADDLLPQLYCALNVQDNLSNYGIDMIWWTSPLNNQ